MRAYLAAVALALVLATVPGPSALADDWVFAGVRVFTKSGSVNKHPTRYGYSWIRRDKSYRANKKLYRQAAKQAHKTKDTSIDFTFRSSKSHNFVAVYNIDYMAAQWKGSKKKVSYYKFYSGADQAAIDKKLAGDRKQHKYVGERLVELIDLKRKKQELNAQAANPVAGRAVQ